MKLSDTLSSAKAMIDSLEKWTQGALARDAEGYRVHSKSRDAVCWCSLGALHASGGGVEGDGTLLRALRKSTGHYDVATYNDEHTHEEVMALWDLAIEMAKQAEEKQ